MSNLEELKAELLRQAEEAANFSEDDDGFHHDFYRGRSDGFRRAAAILDTLILRSAS